jgi:hypothetical protein
VLSTDVQSAMAKAIKYLSDAGMVSVTINSVNSLWDVQAP